MNEPRKTQVSLRGASAREITRDALLEKVNQERELRNYTRRANTAVLFIQRVWRRHYGIKRVALLLQKEWEIMMNNRASNLTKMQMSTQVLRPFLFFTSYLSVRCGKVGDRDRSCMMDCFRFVLENLTSNDVHQNFCSMAIGITEERNIWFHQSKKLISICLFILSVYDYSNQGAQDVVLTSFAMRLAVLLTDPKGWNCIIDDCRKDVNAAVKNLVHFVGSEKSDLYNCIRKFICKLEAPFSSQEVHPRQTDDRFLIIASAITLSLRPFHIRDMGEDDNDVLECAVKEYCVSVLTIPWLPRRLPTILVPALRHRSVLSPCFRMLLVMPDLKREDFSGNF